MRSLETLNNLIFGFAAIKSASEAIERIFESTASSLLTLDGLRCLPCTVGSLVRFCLYCSTIGAFISARLCLPKNESRALQIHTSDVWLFLLILEYGKKCFSTNSSKRISGRSNSPQRF